MVDTAEPLDSASDWVAEHTRAMWSPVGGRPLLAGRPTLVLTTRGRKSAPSRNASSTRPATTSGSSASKGGDDHHLSGLNLLASQGFDQVARHH